MCIGCLKRRKRIATTTNSIAILEDLGASRGSRLCNLQKERHEQQDFTSARGTTTISGNVFPNVAYAEQPAQTA